LSFREYKPPASFDIPEDLRVTLYEWDKNSGRGVLGSKATGEPAVHMGVSSVLALRQAIDAGRTTILKKDPKDWYSLCKFNSVFSDCWTLDGFFLSWLNLSNLFRF
jgi:hypothetical protein